MVRAERTRKNYVGGLFVAAQDNAIELKNITKRFGSVVANDKVCLTVKKGEILSILGENGSGKTTLMNMLSGIYFPDEGEIYVDGKEVTIASPKDSFALGIGMIHQHFKLVDVLTAAENIILGLPGKEVLKMDEVRKKIKGLVDKYGFDLDPDRKIYEMSVSQKQTVEIIKVLYRGANILILDEPTAVLTPQETEKLFAVLRNMRADGRSIIIITHKLHEVLSLSDRVAILRKGKYIGIVETKDATEIRNLGIHLSFVPEDRLGMGLVGSMDITDNMMLRGYNNGHNFFVDRNTPKKLAEDLIRRLEIVTPGTTTPVRRLSGGNVQKVLVGREISSNPTVLMVAYPVRGLDINSSYTIYNLLNEQKEKGVAVICVGEDLDVLLELCDRILVLCGGSISGIVDARTTTKEEIGLLMTKTGKEKKDE